MVVAALRRGRDAFFIPTQSETIVSGDLLLIVGREERVRRLTEFGLQLRPETHPLTTFGLTLTEVIPAPRSGALGKTLRQVNFRGQYGFVAVALLRRQRSFRTDIADIPLEAGDSLLLIGPSSASP